MRIETWKERWHELMEKVIHPTGRHEEEERRGKEHERQRGGPEHRVDENAGSE